MDLYLLSSAPSNGRRAPGNFSNASESPRSVLVFPKQKSQSITATSRSKSIPIPRRRITKQAAASEIMLAEEELLADLRDNAMFTRIVNGMAKKASLIQDPKCRKDFDVCLTHIVATRYLPNEELDERVSSSNDWAYPCIEGRNTMHKGGSPLPLRCSCALVRLGQEDWHALIHHQDDDLILEEMIFEMDI